MWRMCLLILNWRGSENPHRVVHEWSRSQDGSFVNNWEVVNTKNDSFDVTSVDDDKQQTNTHKYVHKWKVKFHDNKKDDSSDVTSANEDEQQT